MLTAIGKKILTANPSATVMPSAAITSGSPAFFECKDYAGSTRYISPFPNSTASFAFIPNALATGSYGYAVGSDGSPESENDYNLGSQITGLTGTGVASTYFDMENYNYISRITLTLSNDTGNEVTVREIGKFNVHYGASTRGANAAFANRATVMIDRTVLDNPVVIPSGEAAVIVYDINLG